MELSNSSGYVQGDKLEQLVGTMGNVTLPLDFWNEFRSEVGDTGELHRNHELLEKLTQFQHHAEHKRTFKLVQSYNNYNPLISLEAHDQGSNAFTCWAFSAASMIRNSCRVSIENLKQDGVLDGLKNEPNKDVYDECMKLINSSLFHVQTRNAILMILVPRHLHVDDESQIAFLRAAVSRIANQTIVDREGIFYLERVTSLVCNKNYLGLDDFPVNVTYKTYYNSHHPDYKTNLKPLIEEAVEKKLCPVAAVDVETIPDGPAGHGLHAMVLDTVRDEKFIFKNTYGENKQVQIPVDMGPLVFYFVHIELTDEGLKKLRERKEEQIKKKSKYMGTTSKNVLFEFLKSL